MKNDKLREYTSDLISFQRHLLSAVRTQKTSDQIKETRAVNLLNDIDVTLTMSLNDFEKFDLNENESRTDKLKERVASIFGTIAGTIDKLREDPVSKMLRDDYTAMSMLASGFTMLNTLALINEEEELAELASDKLASIARLITETSKVLPFVVTQELLGNEKISGEIAERSMEMTQRAWKPEEIFQEA